MSKRNAKKRVRKLDVSAVEEGRAEKQLKKKIDKQIAEGSLFTLDTTGNKRGLSKSLRKALDQEKKKNEVAKNAKRLSELEIAKLKAQVERNKNFARNNAQNLESHKAKEKVAKKSEFDLWGSAEEKGAIGARDRNFGADYLRRGEIAVVTKDKELLETQRNAEKNRKSKSLALVTQARLLPKARPDTLYQRTSQAPAVKLPDNGFSINPGKENQERVVDEIVAREIELETQREDAARRRMPMQARLLDKFTKNELQEMTESTKFREFKKLIAEDMGIEYVSEDEIGEGPETRSSKSLKAAERKTKAERNRSKNVKAARKEESARKQQKKISKGIGQVPALLREMEKEEKARAEKRNFRDKAKAEKLALEKRGVVKRGVKIGRHRFVENEHVVPEKASSSLRTIQTPGSAVSEWMQSAQRRNLTELPPAMDRQFLLRLRKKGKRKARGNKHVQRSLLLGT